MIWDLLVAMLWTLILVATSLFAALNAWQALGELRLSRRLNWNGLKQAVARYDFFVQGNLMLAALIGLIPGVLAFLPRGLTPRWVGIGCLLLMAVGMLGAAFNARRMRVVVAEAP